MRWALASASPRRRELLRAAGFTPEIAAQDVDESALPGEAPLAYVLRVARAKADAYRGDADAVLAADTTVAIDGDILGKAVDDEDGARMLKRLSGRAHAVHTAVVLRRGDQRFERVVTTEVHFRTLTEREIRGYLATGEPRDKAGAYGIQGQGGALVAAVFGSYTNVVGLPLAETLELLSLAGLGGAP